ncbi:MAG: TIGR01777 family oxidoreductase [Acidobacteriota bacterium]
MSKTVGRILISGASGLIGSAVRQAAQQRGYDIRTLVRRHREVHGGAIYWNPADDNRGIHPAALEGMEAIVHLSGASVAQRWTRARRENIVASRVQSTEVLCDALSKVRERPPVLLCASAIGIYGSRGDEVLTESSTAGTGFLAETCQAWEAAAQQASSLGMRVVHLRLGVVLSRKGGALGKMLPVFRMGLGGRLGDGRQWMSWISLRDVVRAIWFLIVREEFSGPFNLTAPQPVTNADFTHALAHALHRPALFPAPAPVLRAAFGEMAEQTLLASARVLPQRLLEAGFDFEDREIGAALHALL